VVAEIYSHVFKEMKGQEKVSAEEAIRAAREGMVSGKCPPGEAAALG
jgi:hypothetical protein